MKKTILSLLLAMCSASAFAGVIGFDDLAGDSELPLASGYQGFNWTNLHAIRANAFPGSGYDAGTVSPSNAVFNYDGGNASISKAGAGTFAFVGAYFTSAWLDQELSFEGSRNGQVVYSTGVSTVVDTTTPLWVGLGWSDIDTLTIYNSSGTAWAMDDFTTNDVEVPEPAPVALFGITLAGLLLARKRKNPSNQQAV